MLKRALLVLLLPASAYLIHVALREPSLNRAWDEDVRVLAGVEMASDGSVLLSNIRDWHYALETITSKDTFDARYDPDDILAIWMYEQELGPIGLIAHTFLVFEFDESYGRGRYLGLSVETRREEGEEYSIIGGALRSFEITHIWATEADLVTRRVQYLDYPLTRYKLEVPAAYRARIFLQFARESQSLASVPRWYNTITNNCTSSLIRYVNQSEPGAIPVHYSYALTGKVDDYLETLGYRSTESSRYIDRATLDANGLR